jgi:DNA-binding LytR/AlgR family response regulator
VLKIAICDDDILACKVLQRIIEEICENIEYEYSIKVFPNGEAFIEDLKKSGNYNIVFLDIQMGAMNGIDVGKTIREVFFDEKAIIIYITALKEYVFDVFDTRPMHFVVKPIIKEKVEAIFKKALLLNEEQKQVFKYKVGHHHCSILLSDILYFESLSRKIRIYTTSSMIEFYGKMSDIIDMNLRDFLQIHRSYVVNSTQMKEHSYSAVSMKNGQQLSIGQSRRKEVMEILTNITISKLKE